MPGPRGWSPPGAPTETRTGARIGRSGVDHDRPPPPSVDPPKPQPADHPPGRPGERPPEAACSTTTPPGSSASGPPPKEPDSPWHGSTTSTTPTPPRPTASCPRSPRSSPTPTAASSWSTRPTTTCGHYPAEAWTSANRSRTPPSGKPRKRSGIDIEVTGLIGVYTNPRHVLAYDDGEVRQQFSLCFTTRMLGGTLRTSSETT